MRSAANGDARSRRENPDTGQIGRAALDIQIASVRREQSARQRERGAISNLNPIGLAASHDEIVRGRICLNPERRGGSAIVRIVQITRIANLKIFKLGPGARRLDIKRLPVSRKWD